MGLFWGSTTILVPMRISRTILNFLQNYYWSFITASPNGLTYAVTYPSISTPDTGFLPGSTNAFNGTTLMSTCVIKLQSEDRLLVHSNIVNNPTDNDVLVSINSSTSINYSSINYTCPAPEFYSRLLTSQNNNTYSFSLTDEDCELIQLNGLNMNFTLLLYKKDDIFDKIRNFMKMVVMKNEEKE